MIYLRAQSSEERQGKWQAGEVAGRASYNYKRVAPERERERERELNA